MKTFKIYHLFYDLLNLYGDRGNIACIEKRLAWRNIPFETYRIGIDDDFDLKDADFVLLGGGSDREQAIVCNRLKEIKSQLVTYIEDNGVLLAICGGYQLLGESYVMNDEIIEGLNILKIKTIKGDKRLIGNVIIDSAWSNSKIVGFENHSGKTLINDYEPLGKVVVGYGNDGQKIDEGIIYKNVIGTYLHGPLLPKNPEVADKLITLALKRKNIEIPLKKLDDDEELMAKDIMIKRLLNM